MNVSIINRLSPRLTLGINVFSQISPPEAKAIDDYIDNHIPSIHDRLSRQLPPGFQYSRRLYRSFKIDPTKTRPSSEALWRRLKNKGDFPRVNPYVDLTNLLSLRFQICYGLYDLDKIDGEIEVCLGQQNDAYPGIRKEILNFKDRIILKDAQGPFGNPSSDSLRTSTKLDSHNILQVLFFHPEDEQIENISRLSRSNFTDLLTIGYTESNILK